MKKKMLVLATTLFIAFGANAKPIPDSKMFNAIRAGLVEREHQEQHLAAFGMSGEKAEIVREYLAALGNDDKYIQYMVSQLKQLGFLDTKAFKNKNEYAEQLSALIGAVSVGLYQKGLIKLSTDDMAVFYEHQIRVMQHMSNEACRAFNLNMPTKRTEIERKRVQKDIFQSMSANEVRRFFDVSLKAQLAAIDETKDRRDLSDIERPLAAKAMRESLVTGLRQLPKEEAIRIAKALDDLFSASNKDVCDTSKFMYKQFLNSSGQARDWIFRAHLGSLQ